MADFNTEKGTEQQPWVSALGTRSLEQSYIKRLLLITYNAVQVQKRSGSKKRNIRYFSCQKFFQWTGSCFTFSPCLSCWYQLRIWLRHILVLKHTIHLFVFHFLSRLSSNMTLRYVCPMFFEVCESFPLFHLNSRLLISFWILVFVFFEGELCRSWSYKHSCGNRHHGW